MLALDLARLAAASEAAAAASEAAAAPGDDPTGPPASEGMSPGRFVRSLFRRRGEGAAAPPPLALASLDVDANADPPRGPAPRKFHGAASLYPWHPLVVAFGGWRVNAHFDDLWLLAVGRDAAALEGFAQLPEPEPDDTGSEQVILVEVPGRGVGRFRIEADALEPLVAGGILVPQDDGTYLMRPDAGAGAEEDDDDEMRPDDDEMEEENSSDDEA